MARVLILGAGGHAQVVCDILLKAYQAAADWQPIGFLDDDTCLIGTSRMGLPILGTIAQVREFSHDAVIVATGDNQTRARIYHTLRAWKERIINAVHPAAVLAPDIHLGEGVMICAGVVVNTGTTIGDNVILNTSCSVDHHNYISSHAQVGPGAHLGGAVCVSEGALIGIGASVLPGRSIGQWAVVGAGAVVVRDVPAFTTAVGVPARVVKRHEPAGE